MPTALPTAAARRRIIAQLEEIERDGHDGDGTITLARGVTLNVTSLGKTLFGKGGATKGDLMRYYTRVAGAILPLMRDRPLSLKRFPHGIGGDFFFQQKAPPDAPAAVRTERVISEHDEPQLRIIGGSLATLLYCVQLGAIDVNPWNARVQSLETPDFTVIDLDPGPRAPFERVVQTALWVKEQLDASGLTGAVKTSGSTGLHIFIPLPANTEESVAEGVARHIAEAVAAAHPRETTVARAIASRKAAQIYVDAGQNSRGKTVAAAYSVRAKPGALVSTPLAWDELTPDLDPSKFTIETVPDRLEELGDLWSGAMRRPVIRRPVTRT